MIARRTVDNDQEVLSRIVNSDVAQILHIFPACDTLRFKFDAGSSENTPDLYVGECGDSEVWVSSTGSVRKIVVRESANRKAGQIFEVRKPLGQYFKAIAPFLWAPTLRDGICFPMAPSTYAIILMYMHIWARKKIKGGIKLPPLVYDDLYAALVMSRRVVEMDRILPEKQRLVPRDTYAKLSEVEQGYESSEAPDSPQVPPTPDTPNMSDLQHNAFIKQSYWEKRDTPMSETPDPEHTLRIPPHLLQERVSPVQVTPESTVAQSVAQQQQPSDKPPTVPPEEVQTSVPWHVSSNISPDHRASAQALMLRLYGQIPGAENSQN